MECSNLSSKTTAHYVAPQNMAGLLSRRKGSDAVTVTQACQTKAPEPDLRAARRQGGDRDDKGRRRSLWDPSRRWTVLMSKTGAGGLLRKMGSVLSLTPTTPRVYDSRKSYKFLPKKKLLPFNQEIVASYSGPYGGLTNSELIFPSTEGNTARFPNNIKTVKDDSVVDGSMDKTSHQLGFKRNDKTSNVDASKWRLRNERAYGMSVSLYEYRNSDKKECTGDPIADVFAIHATRNSCVMAVADGVGWGQGARRAAQCAVKGSMEYLLRTLYSKDYTTEPFTTADVFKCMTESLDEAQELIIFGEGSLTTLCLAVVADVESDDTTSKALCVISVGDSLAFVSSQRFGVKEVTVGCREYNLHRNIRFCNGALGPCLGERPDLENLTYSYTTVEEGDIVFLTSDGVSDNFDPVVAKRAVANTAYKSNRSRAEMIFSEDPWEARNREDVASLPALTPRERQEEMTRTMEEVIRQTETPSDDPFSASNLCSKLLQHAVNLTEKKRVAQEATNNIISLCEKECLEMQAMMTGKEALTRHARGLPGKLDHATVVAYVVPIGTHGNAASNRPAVEEVSARDLPNYFDVSIGVQPYKDWISLID
ncbi:PP2C-like domain-containing protein CG9801 [Acanthaster planci]|uniref:PP2C-like domain-containing protein CG9801 n=1 Tax=Acanthaster planci TaxID=133434 RepID=A0A8B7YVB1_ACAPL|nr:PP2C-like domain-containing protein CG9801 [Acanthaster planci]